ncbi:MAG TPA: hypothetical protein VFA67_02460 [Candidatus Sulfotelmatobacter sp.]|nr:hypothetical protein [Candidatus Sulfotelmatobacter sp.]
MAGKNHLWFWIKIYFDGVRDYFVDGDKDGSMAMARKEIAHELAGTRIGSWIRDRVWDYRLNREERRKRS